MPNTSSPTPMPATASTAHRAWSDCRSRSRSPNRHAASRPSGCDRLTRGRREEKGHGRKVRHRQPDQTRGQRLGPPRLAEQPAQEEVILVVAGKVEQWVDREKRILGPGDSAFIPADVVHASFNVGTSAAKIVAILGPCVGPIGYELVDVANDAPWKTLRK